jgi:hypothetical protein
VEHKHTIDEEQRIREAALDDTIEETFPASDPLSSDPNPDDDTALTRDRTGARRDTAKTSAPGGR